MIKLKLLGATATLFALTAAPALSQQAIQEPGLYAFYHPDGDSMSTRAPTDAMASTVVRARGVHPEPGYTGGETSGLVSDQGSPQGDGAIRAGNRPVIVFRSRAVSDREQQFRAERRPRDPANATYTNALAKYSL